MATITFRSHLAASIFASMASGMADNKRDDDDMPASDAYARIEAAADGAEDLATGDDDDAGEGAFCTIPDADYDAAHAVLENCLDNGPGGQIDGPAGAAAAEEGEDRDYLLEGEVIIALDEPVRINSEYARVPETIDLRQALRLAIAALADAREAPRSERAQAHDWLIELYQQGGCEHLGEGEDMLVENCQIFIRG